MLDSNSLGKFAYHFYKSSILQIEEIVHYVKNIKAS